MYINMYIACDPGQSEGTSWREVRVIALAHTNQHELACHIWKGKVIMSR